MNGAPAHERRRNFAFGFLGGLLGNTLLALLLAGLGAVLFSLDLGLTRRTSDTLALLAYCGLPLLLNGVGIVILFGRRPRAALGAGVALGVLSLLAVILGGVAFWYLFVSGY